jgi:hypothetical protein
LVVLRYRAKFSILKIVVIERLFGSVGCYNVPDGYSAYMKPTANIPATLILLPQLRLNFEHSYMGKMSIMKSRTMLTTLLPNDILVILRHFAGDSRAHPVQAAWTGVHWKRSIVMNVIMTTILSTITPVVYLLKFRDGKKRRKKKHTEIFAIPIWALYKGAMT